MSNTAGIILMGIGLLFNLFGCVGLIRLPDVYNRLQAATKCVTLGTCFILAGVVVMSNCVPCAVKAVVCAAFILITSPTAAHALAKGSHLSGVKLWEKSVVDEYAKDKASGAVK